MCVRYALSDGMDECYVRPVVPDVPALGDGKDECHVRHAMPHVPALSEAKARRLKYSLGF